MSSTFRMDRFLADQGLRVVGPADAPGSVRVRTESGDERLMNAAKLASDLGVKDYSFNSASNPELDAEVGFLERGKLAVGNAAGAVAYLKKNYDDVRYNKDHGLLVKKNGFWGRVNPDGVDLGDAWDVAKVIASGALQTAGALAGTAAAGPAGSIAGAGAGAAIERGAEALLGKAFGTYQANSSELAADLGFEFLLGAGGQAVVLGAKPGLDKLRSALRDIRTKAAPAVAEAIETTVNKIAGVPRPSIATALSEESGDAVVSRLAAARAKYGSASGVSAGLKQEAVATLERAARDPRQQLYAYYDAGKKEIIDLAADTLTTSGDDIAKAMSAPLQASGVAMLDDAGKLRMMTNREIAAARAAATGQAQPVANLVGESGGVVESFIKNLNDLAEQYGKASGKRGAAQLLDMNRSLNAAKDAVNKANIDSSIKQAVNNAYGVFLEQLQGKLGPKANEAFIMLQANYAAKKPMVEMLENAVLGAKAMKSKAPPELMVGANNQVEVFLNAISTEFGNRAAYKRLAGGAQTGMLNDMRAVYGDKFIDAMKEIAVMKAAADFAPFLSRAGLAPAVAAGTSGAAAAVGLFTGNPLALLAPAITSTVGSPRLNLAAINIARKSLGTLKNTSPGDRYKLLQNPQLFEPIFRGMQVDITAQELNNLSNGAIQRATGR